MENSHAIFTSMMLKGISEQNQHLSEEVEKLKKLRQSIESSIHSLRRCVHEKTSAFQEIEERQVQNAKSESKKCSP